MPALARALPDKILSLSEAARDLTETATDLTRRELDRARDLSSVLRERLDGVIDGDTRASLMKLARREADRARDLSNALRRRLGGLVDRDTPASLVKFTRREVDQARDLSSALRQRLGGLAVRDRRSSRLPLVVSAVVVGVAVGGVLLANPRVRASLRQGWDFLRGRRPSQPLSLGDGLVRPVIKPAHERQEDLLDEGIEESFPASDPVSVKRIT